MAILNGIIAQINFFGQNGGRYGYFRNLHLLCGGLHSEPQHRAASAPRNGAGLRTGRKLRQPAGGTGVLRETGDGVHHSSRNQPPAGQPRGGEDDLRGVRAGPEQSAAAGAFDRNRWRRFHSGLDGTAFAALPRQTAQRMQPAAGTDRQPSGTWRSISGSRC